MRICLTLKAIITTIVLIVAQTVEVNAANNRSWVSGSSTANDSNPCSRTMPCATFAGALLNTNGGGEIDALDPGDFSSTPTTINQGVTIDGTDTLAGFTTATTGVTGITVATGSEAVVIRNITFNGVNQQGAIAIDFQVGGQLVIENCKFIGFLNAAIQLSSDDIKNPTNVPTNLVIKNSTITNCGIGLLIEQTVPSTSSIVLDNVSISNTNSGLQVESGKVDIWNCFISQNFTGIASTSSCTINCLNSLLTSNGSAISTSGSATVFISNNDFYDNVIGFDTSAGGVIETANNNRFSNNGNTTPISVPTSSITIQ